MRNSTNVSTPKSNSVQDESASNTAEKSCAKKLRQARLPFKVIAPGTPPVDSIAVTTPVIADEDAIKETHSTDDRKRKLSYDTDDDVVNVDTKEDDKVSKENVKILKATTKKKKLSAVSNDTTEVVSLLDDDEHNVDEGNRGDVENSSFSVPDKEEGADKRKGAGTPQTSNAQNKKKGSATKLQIKLPLSGGKKKRRKSSHSQLPLKGSAADLSNDDIEDVVIELNPQKRKKLNTDYNENNKSNTICSINQEQKTELLDSEPEEKSYKRPKIEKSSKATSGKNALKSEKTKKTFEQCNGKGKLKEDSTASPNSEKASPNSKNGVFEESFENDTKIIEISESSDDDEKEKNDKEAIEESIISDNDNEADDETDNVAGNSVNVSSDISEHPKLKQSNTIQLIKDENNSGSSSKNLTPKQLKLMEQRHKAREEKERKLQEEKMKKQQEKEEKELLRKREREEKDEQKKKEREEKEEQKRKEREEKERKRLAEIEAKNEEKRKKNEAKEEELRKKEEERKRKEQEKKEADLKKKKAAQAFTKFFVPRTTSSQVKNEEDSNTGDGAKLLAFRPFQIKGDMKLAPICRKMFTEEEKNRLDVLLGCSDETYLKENVVENQIVLTEPQLYLSELRSGKTLPGKWRRFSTESKDDVILVDELERVGQEIVEDTPAYIREEMRVKFYKFHDNRRPPYYGTWRKRSAVVKARKPFAQDMKFFDYEVDSDDEWEEEEPGESLEDGSDEDKEKESEDDEYEVDNEWFVPHGHLSDEELQNEDEFGMGDDNTREAQKVKLQILQQEFAQEMKKKTEKIKPRLMGCIWADINGNQPPDCAKIIWDTLEKKAMLFIDPPLIEEPEADRSTEPNSPSSASNNTERVSDKIKPITLSDEMVRDLTRLIHGNNHAKNFLINEYIAYVEKTEESVRNGGLRKPLKSVVRDKIDEIAEWQAVDATANNIHEMEQANDETNDKKKKKVKRRLCWVVQQDMLNKLNLSSLELKNSWNYTLQPKFVKANKELKKDEAVLTLSREIASIPAEGSVKINLQPSQKTEIAKASTTEEKTTKSENTICAKPSSADKSTTEIKANVPTRPKEKKRVPLLMSVARGQQIPTPAKNKLISQFLHTKNKDNVKSSSPTTATRRSNAVASPDDVVILD